MFIILCHAEGENFSNQTYLLMLLATLTELRMSVDVVHSQQYYYNRSSIYIRDIDVFDMSLLLPPISL